MATKAMSYFRKHQKVILAVVTIGTMLIFIVGDAVQSMARGGSSRSGGFFGWVSNLFTGGGEKEDTLFKVAGKQYSAEQVSDLQQHRQFALDVMNTIGQQGFARFLDSQGVKEDEMRDRNKLQQKIMELSSKDPAVRDAITERDNNLLSQIRPSLLTFEMMQQFGTEPPISIAEFVLMKSKANELGVTVAADSIKNDLLKLGMNKISADELSKIVREGARARGLLDMAKLDSVLYALADEVRVAIAKQIVNEDISGSVSGIGKAPQITPADLWNNYVNVKTSLSTGIVPLKVEDYLSRVPAPTESELLAFFDKYKKDYPNVDSDTPGFKIPPKYRIGLVFGDMKEGQAASKHYRAQVDAYDLLHPFSAVAEIASEYNSKKDKEYRSVLPFMEFALSKVPGSPWVRVYSWHARQDHANVANVLGNFALAISTVGTFSPANAFALTLHGEKSPEQQNVMLQAVQSVAGSSSLAGILTPFLSQHTGSKNVFTDFNTVAPALIQKRYETRSKELLAADLDELTKALGDYGKKYNEWRSKVARKLIPANSPPPLFNETTKQTLADYLTKFTAARGLSYYETKDLRARDNLFDEPGERLLNNYVKPLYYDQTERRTPKQLESFVKDVLVQNEILGYKPKLFEATNSSIHDSKAKNKEYVLTWVAEGSDPRTPDFKEAEPAVVKAWKMEKARPLVEEDAQKIIKDVNASPDNYRKLIDMKGYVPGQVIARYTEPELSSTSPMPMYKPAPIPKVLDNPPDDFVKQALDKLKVKGDATVIPDKSKSTYYLLYLSNRSEPKTTNPLDLETFHNEVIRPSQMKQMLVDNNTFRNYATQSVMNKDVESWIEYLKGLTGLTLEKMQEYVKYISNRRG
ncbi:MAG TPA: hypothetical protein PLN21_17010 [Gemmatales bacterium]|nr:hypothetical protein [Gemmatales bacterium]